MHIVIWAEPEKVNLLIEKDSSRDWIIVENEAAFLNAEGDVYLNLNDDANSIDYSSMSKPILVNSVAFTLKEIRGGKNIIRINGWNSFLKNDAWEIAGQRNNVFDEFFKQVNKKIIECADEPGFISAKIISMIINEAYYTKYDGVSNETDIDTAMKLGTNYPYGPFEWASIIGRKNIYQLLEKLSAEDERYLPAPGLLS